MIANKDKFQVIILSKTLGWRSFKLNIYDNNIETAKLIKLLWFETDHHNLVFECLFTGFFSKLENIKNR